MSSAHLFSHQTYEQKTNAHILRLEDVILGLRSLALISMNRDSTLFTVHRLIQGEYRAYIEIQEQVGEWHLTVTALRELFPKQHKGSTMFNEWRTCEKLIEHVEVLAKRYSELSETTEIEYYEDFAYIISDASRLAPC